MTIKKCIRQKGIKRETAMIKKYINVTIVFINPETHLEDETEFSVSSQLLSGNANELNDLYKTFCSENGFAANTVTDIYVTQTADTLEELD